MNIKFDEKIPIYIQIMNYIKENIISGKLNPGDKLPSVRDMSALLKVNPNTLQRAYQELERENVTYTQRGMGTFVKEDEKMIEALKKDMAKEVIDLFIEKMKNIGFTEKEIVKIIEEKLKEDKNNG
ncbi:DNA-binding transcriptional regulator YhcF (GntR family) [Clostridium tetanomorphum]|uniref:GntR family transcriptional regulator n=1 Tax=Clostridium tetanomorphum TaxID=1553 RepID=A0A923IZF5_CLOTT|nr:GntR family transcriptional regulator [Clostridium tetanomorphum]KAJ49754.1 GntR family transcriptional regulator [Clostridium tetanomorphum DSM 665]KAJ53147.1 GntR family transcriptional regulator [Clostridium tetanomorphum DSM 665]MBC2396942.1 GntR family transcriptional regulator [Clostridium tetanomorphum]MBP1863091.1 DNA-binding transcriptional regulator YhcF (GntR family) [Clostridium tetanomorphum]NRS84200.1 DNA-binding transcriptional regulator YhcF (GntR family) [Clostridium tetano